MALATIASPAAADPIQWHAEAGTARAVGGWQGYEYGSGGDGSAAVELPFGRVIGVQAEATGLWLPHVNPSQSALVVSGGDGSAIATMAGVRVHPFGDCAGAWIDGDAGYVHTGADGRFGFDLHVGYDFRVDQGRLDVGPYVGYLHVVEPASSLRPDDAQIVSIGIHVAMGRERPRVLFALARATPAKAPPVVTAPPPEPVADRDEDGVPDMSDACPAVPGVHTSDPRTDGCPPHADVRVVDNHIEYDDTILFTKSSPEVDEQSWPMLRKLAAFITDNRDIGKVDIAGHADERGTDHFNDVLSRRRARAVRALLVRFGVDPARLVTESFGESRPRAPGHTEDDWRQNRRVELTLVRADASTHPSLGVEEQQR